MSRLDRAHPASTSQLRYHFIAVPYFLFLTIAATWPLALNLKSRVPGFYISDNYEYLWKMWWFGHALLDLKQSPLVAPHILYPQGFQLAHAELTPLHTVIGLPLTRVAGEILTYNLFAMLSFLLAGWATFALVNRWTRNLWAALLAGTLFILNPYHMVRYGGILPLMAIEGIPIYLLGLDAWIESRRIRWIVLAGLGFLIAAWASLYYAFGLLVLSPFYAVARASSCSPREMLQNKQTWGALALLAALIALALLPTSIPHLQLGEQVELIIPLEEVDFWSASVTDYLVPPGLHPLWGTWVRENLLAFDRNFPEVALEFVLGVGFVTLLFAFYGWRKYNGAPKRAVLWLIGAALVFSLGTRLHFGRHPVVIPAPESIVEGFHGALNAIGAALPAGETYDSLSEDGLTLPLPALLLRWLLPPLAGLRAWNRFAVFVALGLSLLAGLGYAAWISLEVRRNGDRATQGKEWLAGIVVLSIALLELWPQPIPLQPVAGRAVDRWLASQPGQFTIMELPLVSALGGPQMMYTRFHGKRTAFAYGTYFPYWYREQYPELETCPDQECLKRLREWGVLYVLLNREALSDDSPLERELDRDVALVRLFEEKGIVVYQISYEYKE